MSSRPKFHYQRKASWGYNMMCGGQATFITEDIEKITCKTCRKLAEKLNGRDKCLKRQ